MTDERDELPDVPALRVLEPPANGLVVLRERLDASERRRWWLVAVPATLAIAAAILLFVLPRSGPIETAEPSVATMAPPPRVPPPRPLPEPAAGPDVQFYWVASSQAGSPEMPAAQPAYVSVDQVPHVTTYKP